MTQYTQGKLCGENYFAGLLLVFLSYFVPPLLVLRDRWTALILASWWLLLAAHFLLFWVTGSLQLGCLEHSLHSLSLRLPVFVICSVYPLLLSVVFPVTYPFLQVRESPSIPNSSWSCLTGNLSYSRVRTCDGSYMELRCLFFIAIAFAFIFLINFNKPLTFLLIRGPPNPRFHPFNVYWRDLRRTVAFHSSRKSCTLFVKSTGLLWSRLNIKPPKGFLALAAGIDAGRLCYFEKAFLSKHPVGTPVLPPVFMPWTIFTSALRLEFKV